MNATGLFPASAQWMAGAHLGIVTSVEDPLGRGRVQVRLPAADPDNDAPVWARVAVPFAGDNFGAFLIPGVGAEVLVLFTANDPDFPVVVGALWNGSTARPESLPGNAVDRWSLTGKNGTRIAIIEESAGQETVEITTPKGAKAKLTDGSGGEIRLEVAGNRITMGTAGVKVVAASQCKVDAPMVTVSSSFVKVDAPYSRFTGMVHCDLLLTTSVISSSYTPGAGNVW